VMEIFQSRATSVSISASTTSAAVALVEPVPEGGQVRVVVGEVAGAAWIYLRFGTSGSITALTTDIPMLPNSVQIFTVGRGMTHVAARTDAGTAVVKIVTGRGV